MSSEEHSLKIKNQIHKYKQSQKENSLNETK